MVHRASGIWGGWVAGLQRSARAGRGRWLPLAAGGGHRLPRQWRPPRRTEPGPAAAPPAARPRFRARALVTGLWRDHRLIAGAVTPSLIPRILAALAFRPARFTPDSFPCMAEGVHP